jgi:elongator complex protein 3
MKFKWLRHLGVTKVQMGAQSFNDHILEINKRGHDVESTRQATALLRAAGFKIVLHWMPNLLGATPESDREDFAQLWNDFCPDEIKIYPNQLLANAELYEYWQRGEFQPYTTDELVQLIADIKPSIPRYCRVNRVIRDIPSNNVVEGNRRTSLRQDVQETMKQRGTRCQCIRCREVKGKTVELSSLHMDDLIYQAGKAEEHFIAFNTTEDGLAGFIRLSLPSAGSPDTGISDLAGAALIREVHVYGQSLAVGAEKSGAAQHVGLGTRLLEEAERSPNKTALKKSPSSPPSAPADIISTAALNAGNIIWSRHDPSLWLYRHHRTPQRGQVHFAQRPARAEDRRRFAASADHAQKAAGHSHPRKRATGLRRYAWHAQSQTQTRRVPE